MRTNDLCQLGGTPRTDTVNVLAPVDQVSTMVEIYGGAVCSLQCMRLPARRHSVGVHPGRVARHSNRSRLPGHTLPGPE